MKRWKSLYAEARIKIDEIHDIPVKRIGGR